METLSIVFPIAMKEIIDGILKQMKRKKKVVAMRHNTDEKSVTYSINFASIYCAYEFGWNQREHFETKGNKTIYSF